MIEHLDWDTNFFGYSVGRVNITNGEQFDIDTLKSEASESGYRLLYLFSEAPLNIGLSPIDIKLIYTYNIQEEDSQYALLPEIVEPNCDIYSLAYRSGLHSRYAIDKNFESGKFEELYDKWVDNSLSGAIADKLFRCEIDAKDVGFVTIAIKERTAVIGLIAVDANFGRRGIGSALIGCSKRYAYDRGCSEINVATQQHNIEACAFYEKNGFTILNKTYIYHLWL